MTSWLSALIFQWKNHCACTPELPTFICTSTSIHHARTPNIMKALNPFVSFLTQFPCLWHIRSEELRTCKRIGYEYYCEELFVVKSKSKYSCASALYFEFYKKTIKEICIFDYYFNKTDVKPSILDGGHEIVLANWPNFKWIVCSTHCK